MFETNFHSAEHEALIASLNDPEALKAYKAPYDNVQVGWVPKVLGDFLVSCGNFFYGEKPSYSKFKAVEVIARIPYQSWEVATYVFLSAFYGYEKKAIELTQTSNFSRVAQDNETMHVVMLSQIVKREGGDNFILHYLVPLVFSFFYFCAVFILYFVSPRRALELNYLFESHAFEQYSRFLDENAEDLKKKPVLSDFLNFYGRNVRNEYELFQSIRNDEIVHRNTSIHRAQDLAEGNITHTHNK